MPVEYSNLRVNRRGFLKLAGLVTAASQLPDSRSLSTNSSDQPVIFDSSKLGTNFVPESPFFYDLEPEEIEDIQFSLPFKRVRVPIRFSDVSPEEGRYDFSYTDKLIDKVLSYGKIIDIQFGAKTIGANEVMMPKWIYKKHPYLLESYAQLDRHPDVQESILEYIDESWKHYSHLSQISSVQVENEPFSRILDVTRYRWLSYEFNMVEINHLRSLDPLKRPIVQNFPWDNPLVWGQMLTSSNIDILGVNIYNNIYVELLNKLLWMYIEKTFREAETYQKSVLVTEYQIADWLNDDKTSKYPFSESRREHGLRKLQQLGPDGLHIWDIPQLIWRAKNGDTEVARYLYQDLPNLAA